MTTSDLPTADRLTAAVLTEAQAASVEHYRALNVRANWFVGEPRDGEVEVLALGIDYVWSFLLDANGDCTSAEATVGDFSTGIEV